MPKEYEPSFKKEVIRRYEQGVSLNALSQEFHVALSTLYHWRKEYCSIQTVSHTYTPKEFDMLTRRLQKAEHELCEALDVARGTFYNHIFRRADRTKYEREQEYLMQKVQQIFDDSGQRFGAEKIRVTSLPRVQTMFGSAILHISESMVIGSIFVQF